LIIDGGSDDGSTEIIRRYEGQITFWVSEPDRGQAHAINKGLKKATGELVAWLNSDDFYLPGALEIAAKGYLENPNASFYYGNGLRVDINGSKKSEFFTGGTVCFNKGALVYGLNYILQPSTFINAKLLSKIGYLNDDLHYGLDTDLWIRLSSETDPQPLPGLIAASREYQEAKTFEGSFQRIEELRRIAEKYSGQPMTPGVLLYFLDTLHRFVEVSEGIFPLEFRKDIEQFWAKAANIMSALGAGPDGIPLRTVKGSTASQRNS